MTNLEPIKCHKCGKNIIALSQEEAGCEDKMCRRIGRLERSSIKSSPLRPESCTEVESFSIWGV